MTPKQSIVLMSFNIDIRKLNMPVLSTLNFDKSRKALGAQGLADQLRKALDRGVLERGDRMPTIRQLTEETGLAYNAVNRAFAILQNEGLLVSRKRAGTFVAEGPAADEASRKQEDRESKVRVFALVGPELSTGFYPTLQKGLGAAAGKAGYQIIASDTGGDVGIQADTIMQLMDKSISGVALVPTTLGAPPVHQIRLLQKQGIPVVLLHRGIEGVSAPQIAIPAERVGEQAAQQLIDHGHTQVAYCTSQRVGSAIGYEKGFRRTLEGASLDLPESRIFSGDFKLFDKETYAACEAELANWFGRLMASDDRPTAVFTSFESLGEILYLVAMQLGLRIPDDLSIITVGGADRTGAVVRRLASITLDENKVGSLAADLLNQMNAGSRAIDDAEVFAVEIGFDFAGSLGRPSFID